MKRIWSYAALALAAGVVLFWLASFRGLPFEAAPTPTPVFFLYDAAGRSDSIIPLDMPAAGAVKLAYGSNGKGLLKLEMYAGGETALVRACAAACDREEELRLEPGRVVFSVRCEGCEWYVIVGSR